MRWKLFLRGRKSPPPEVPSLSLPIREGELGREKEAGKGKRKFIVLGGRNAFGMNRQPKTNADQREKLSF